MTSECFEVLMQKLFKKINVFVCVVYTEFKKYREERKNAQGFIVVHLMWASPLLTIL
jgi:hypothetical protein